MTFTLNAEVAAVLAAAIEQNGPPPTAPVGDVASRRVALDAMLGYFNNEAQPAAGKVDIADHRVLTPDGAALLARWYRQPSVGRHRVRPGQRSHGLVRPAVSAGRLRRIRPAAPDRQATRAGLDPRGRLVGDEVTSFSAVRVLSSYLDGVISQANQLVLPCTAAPSRQPRKPSPPDPPSTRPSSEGRTGMAACQSSPGVTRRPLA